VKLALTDMYVRQFCTMMHAHACEQLLDLHVDLGFDFVFVCLFRFTLNCMYYVSSVRLDHFNFVLLAFIVLG